MKSLKIFIFYYSAFIVLMPLIQAGGKFIFAMNIYALMCVYISNKKNDHVLKNIIVICIVFILLLSCLVALGNQDFIYFAPASWLILAMLNINLLTKDITMIVLRQTKIFLYILTTLGAISVIYSIFGGEYIYSILNPDGRENFFYLGSFSNSIVNGVIRPAGLFDEPGTFAFVISSYLLWEYSITNKKNYTLLVMGMITTSLAYLMFVFFFMLSDSNLRSKIKIFLAVATIISLTLIVGGDNLTVQRLLFDRVTEVSGGSLGNRQSYTEESLEIINRDPARVIVYGYNPACVSSSDCNGRAESICCQPFAPLVQYGALSSIYYLLLIFPLIGYIQNKRASLALLGYTCLLLQRPNLFQPGYSVLILFTYYIYLKYESNFLSKYIMKNKYIRRFI